MEASGRLRYLFCQLRGSVIVDAADRFGSRADLAANDLFSGSDAFTNQALALRVLGDGSEP